MLHSNVSRRQFMGASLGVVAAAAGLVGCAGASSASTSASASGASDSATSATDTAMATIKPVILVVSFGTSYASSRHITIGAIESDIREAFPDYDVRRAFTAQTIIDHVQKDTGRHIDNFKEAMNKIVAAGVKRVIVQPTHLMDGFEYQDIVTELKDYEGKFDEVAVGAPLLATAEDRSAVIEAIHEVTKKYEDDATAVCLMGHGTEAESNSVYATIQTELVEKGYKNYFVATVEATPTFAVAVKAAKDAGYTKAVLRPLMVVAGDHATNDMADTSDPESLASLFAAAGFEVTSMLEGLGQIVGVDEVYVAHVQNAIDSL